VAEATVVGMGFFDVPDDSEWTSPGRAYVVARYDLMQIVGRTWRPSLSNPHAGSEEEL